MKYFKTATTVPNSGKLKHTKSLQNKRKHGSFLCCILRLQKYSSGKSDQAWDQDAHNLTITFLKVRYLTEATIIISREPLIPS